MSITTVKLSKEEKHKKYKLALLAGYLVEEFDKKSRSPRCYIVGADKYIDNDFRNIDDVLLFINRDLLKIGFSVAAWRRM